MTVTVAQVVLWGTPIGAVSWDADLRAVAKRFQLFRGKQLDAMLEQIDGALEQWPSYAESAGVEERRAAAIGSTFRRLTELRRPPPPN